MLGEIFSLASAFAFALTNVAIAKASGQKRGDNGAFLSIVMTFVISAALWLVIGMPVAELLSTQGLLFGLVMFVLSGVLSMVVGRNLMFKSIMLAGAINGSLFRRLIPVFAGIFAFLLLGETISFVAIIGMAIILASVLAAMKPATPVAAVRQDDRPERIEAEAVEKAASAERASVQLGKALGALSAVSYGGSHVARKIGMQPVPDPTLGAMVGAVVGIVWYLFAAIFSARYRQVVTGLIRDAGRWQIAAAASMSIGQILLFYGLRHTEVAIVAIIGSLEVFISIYLAAYLFRTEQPPGRRTIIASIAATFGVVLVALA